MGDSMNKRWYDNHEGTLAALEILKNLDAISREKLLENVVEIANQIKAIHRDENEPPLSLGIERVLGLYQSSNSRRWYDKNDDLCRAIQTLSTLPKEDFLNIMEGLAIAIND